MAGAAMAQHRKLPCLSTAATGTVSRHRKPPYHTSLLLDFVVRKSIQTRACNEEAASSDGEHGAQRDSQGDFVPGSGRRGFLAAAAAVPLLLAAAPQGATAAARFEGFLPLPPPDPVKVPRKTLDQKFAVLMMRSAYETADALNFIPMDEFQVKFWKLRQAEYSPYTLQYSPIVIRQGQLTDPLYFDFINYTQYALLAKEMPKGRQVFEEFCEIEEECPDGRKRVVRRDQTYSDNSMLPSYMEAGIGDKMYNGLVNGFEGEYWGGPVALSQTAAFEETVAGVRKIIEIFVDKGYALRGSVLDVTPDAKGNGGSFTVRLDAPCNFWGIQRLGSQRAPLVNAMDAMTVGAFLRASGREASYTLETTDVGVQEQWVIPSTL